MVRLLESSCATDATFLKDDISTSDGGNVIIPRFLSAGFIVSVCRVFLCLIRAL